MSGASSATCRAISRVSDSMRRISSTAGEREAGLERAVLEDHLQVDGEGDHRAAERDESEGDQDSNVLAALLPDEDPDHGALRLDDPGEECQLGVGPRRPGISLAM